METEKQSKIWTSLKELIDKLDDPNRMDQPEYQLMIVTNHFKNDELLQGEPGIMDSMMHLLDRVSIRTKKREEAPIEVPEGLLGRLHPPIPRGRGRITFARPADFDT